MSKVLDELLALLALEKIEEGLFRGQSQDLGLRAVFGGQVMGQALSAAKQTVASDRQVHSFHSYFLRPGDANRPIVYDVENIRDGQTVSTRRVKAIQGGKPIFYLNASFQVEAEGFEHQIAMPAGITPPSSSRANWSWCAPTSSRSRPPCATRSCARSPSKFAR